MGPEGSRVLSARMMRKSDAALVTFQGIRVFYASHTSERWNAGANPPFPRNRFAMSARHVPLPRAEQMLYMRPPQQRRGGARMLTLLPTLQGTTSV